jgi:hypothetical protein
VFPALSTLDRSTPPSRQDANDNDQKRPLTATQNATHPLPEDADLIAVIEAWDQLPEAIRQGIVAMVRASKKSSC